MSLNKKSELTEIAKSVKRELRKKETNAERIFWQRVRNRKLNNRKFYRQYAFYYDIEGKESFFIADFYCHEEKLIVEIDGSIHDNQTVQDAMRTEILNYYGLKVIRFKNQEIENNISKVLEKLKESFRNDNM